KSSDWPRSEPAKPLSRFEGVHHCEWGITGLVSKDGICFENTGLLRVSGSIFINNMSTTTINLAIQRICLWAIVLATARSSQSMPADISFSQSAQSVEVYDFVEVTLGVSKPDAGNPFTDVTLQ